MSCRLPLPLIFVAAATGAGRPPFASPAVEASLKATVGKVDYAREARYYAMLSEGLSDTFRILTFQSDLVAARIR